MRGRESGFTLLELMVTIAVISILAAIALPSYFAQSRKAKAIAEVQPLFNDLRVRLEQYIQENGHYPVLPSELTYWPTAAPDGTLHVLNSNSVPLPAEWQALKVRISGNNQVYCGYTWFTGLANDNTGVGTIASTSTPSGFGFTAPATDWYYLLAKCNMDTDSGSYSYYFASSGDPTIQKLREGD